MSNTIRRSKFNKKKRHFVHYWDCFSEKEVNQAHYIEAWKYHSDNYYTKSTKKRKQYHKNYADRQIRRESKAKLDLVDNKTSDVVLNTHTVYCVRWKIH